MNRFNDDNFNNKENILSFLWLFPAIVPLLVILFSYIFHPWSWGLMDDIQILNSGDTIWEKFSRYFPGLIQFGVFRPTFALHAAVFYKVFEQSARLFYIFKLLEVGVILVIWGYLACKITKTKVAFVLLPAITLSFHYFYDVFFYLSSHEYLGLFFLGISLLCFYNSFKTVLEPHEESCFRWGNWVGGVVCLLIAFGAKETFVSAGIAIGLTFFVLSFQYRKIKICKPLLFSAFFLFILSGVYSFLLMRYVKSGYSSSYSFFGNPKIIGNIFNWAKKDLMNHVPWIFGGCLILWLSRQSLGKKEGVGQSFWVKNGWVFCLSIFLYGGFFAILLPWNVLVYYAAPLGLFFAFLIVVLISSKLKTIGIKWNVFFVICSLVLNMFICQYALKREQTHQADTIQLEQWLSENIIFKTDVLKKGATVRCNAQEASMAIPLLVNRKYNITYKTFVFTSKFKDILQDKKTLYYVWARYWGDQDLRRLGNMWTPMFVSESWYVFKRME